jgi:Dual specificity phosphatase, catalytic domain
VKKLSVTVPARAPLPRGPRRARADEGWNELPSHAPDEIIPGLWMGGSPLGGYGDFDVVVNLEHAAPSFEFDGVHVHWPIDDGPMPDPTTALALGGFVAECVRLGRKVLVHCSAGLNRSGLIVALALVALGYEPPEAMARMRRLRSEWVLCNDNFEEFVLDRKRLELPPQRLVVDLRRHRRGDRHGRELPERRVCGGRPSGSSPSPLLAGGDAVALRRRAIHPGV